MISNLVNSIEIYFWEFIIVLLSSLKVINFRRVVIEAGAFAVLGFTIGLLSGFIHFNLSH
jgi:hypothetical protein